MADPANAAQQAEGAAFIFLPHRHMHESWRAAILAQPVWELLAGCPRTEGRLAAFVAQAVGLRPVAPSLAAGNPKARFCRLPWPALRRVAAHLGLALNATRFGRIIDGKLVARLRHDIGNAAFDFALHRAPLITHDTDPLEADLEVDGLSQQLERSGVNYIGLALADLDAGVRERFALRLPKDYASLLSAPRGRSSCNSAWNTVRRVVREAEPEWSASLE